MTPLFCGSECAHEIVCGCSASKTLLAVKFSAQLTGTTRYDKFGKHTCNRSFTSTEQYATIYVMEEFSLLTSDEEPSTRGEANDPWDELSLISEDEEFSLLSRDFDELSSSTSQHEHEKEKYGKDFDVPCCSFMSDEPCCEELGED